MNENDQNHQHECYSIINSLKSKSSSLPGTDKKDNSNLNNAPEYNIELNDGIIGINDYLIPEANDTEFSGLAISTTLPIPTRLPESCHSAWNTIIN